MAITERQKPLPRKQRVLNRGYLYSRTDDDIKNPNTDTVKDHIRRDVKITVPKLVMGSGTSK